ncbi:uncharacterized protein METZ01_LOCUS40785, partial [marine metagenome]
MAKGWLVSADMGRFSRSNIFWHHLDRTTGAFGNTKPTAF